MSDEYTVKCCMSVEVGVLWYVYIRFWIVKIESFFTYTKIAFDRVIIFLSQGLLPRFVKEDFLENTTIPYRLSKHTNK